MDLLPALPPRTPSPPPPPSPSCELSGGAGGSLAAAQQPPSPMSPPGGGGGGGGAHNSVSSVMLHGTQIVCLHIDGKERLCLAQISNTLLKNFSYNEIHNRRVALGITCVQCTPVQLEILRRAGAMPISSRRCGMITKREAERLVKSFLEEHCPPQLPENFAFSVRHTCGWGCRGQFIPARYNSSRAKCIKCAFCAVFFSPNKFIFHFHRGAAPDAKYRHPDAANFNSWRRHLDLDYKIASEELVHAWEDVKAMFNGGSRKRVLEPGDSPKHVPCGGGSSDDDSCFPPNKRAMDGRLEGATGVGGNQGFPGPGLPFAPAYPGAMPPFLNPPHAMAGVPQPHPFPAVTAGPQSHHAAFPFMPHKATNAGRSRRPQDDRFFNPPHPADPMTSSSNAAIPQVAAAAAASALSELWKNKQHPPPAYCHPLGLLWAKNVGFCGPDGGNPFRGMFDPEALIRQRQQQVALGIKMAASASSRDDVRNSSPRDQQHTTPHQNQNQQHDLRLSAFTPVGGPLDTNNCTPNNMFEAFNKSNNLKEPSSCPPRDFLADCHQVSSPQAGDFSDSHSALSGGISDADDDAEDDVDVDDVSSSEMGNPHQQVISKVLNQHHDERHQPQQTTLCIKEARDTKKENDQDDSANNNNTRDEGFKRDVGGSEQQQRQQQQNSKNYSIEFLTSSGKTPPVQIDDRFTSKQVAEKETDDSQQHSKEDVDMVNIYKMSKEELQHQLIEILAKRDRLEKSVQFMKDSINQEGLSSPLPST